jgi:phage gpG-like protein
MPRFLDVEILGVQRLQRQLLRGAERAGSMQPALKRIRQDIWDTIRKNFDTEGTYSGPMWHPVSEEWFQRKLAANLSEMTLEARGRLREAFTGRSRYTRSTVYHDRVVIDSSLPYASKMQYGDDDQNIPARPFARWRPADRERWVKMATADLMRAMKPR